MRHGFISFVSVSLTRESQPDQAAAAVAAVTPASRRDAKRIKDLEKQVEELQEVIKRRNPDALSELIRATKPSAQETAEVAFLQDKIKRLEEREQMHQDEMVSTFIVQARPLSY
jgi:transposase